MPRSIVDESYDPIYERIRGILGEHFQHYCFVVMDDTGEIFFDYDHLPAGKMLLSEATEDINLDSSESDYDWEYEDTDEDGEAEYC